MIEKAGRRGPRGRKRHVLGWVLTAALALGGLSESCRAAELPGPGRPAGLFQLLASVTILSDASMAKEQATGLQNPIILNDPTGRQRVMLWDELKASPQLAPATEPVINTGK